jgi:hypothetical protein
MLDYHPTQTVESDGLIHIVLVVVDDMADPGIRSVRVQDRFNVALVATAGGTDTPGNCAHGVAVDLMPISHERLPVTAIVTECATDGSGGTGNTVIGPPLIDPNAVGAGGTRVCPPPSATVFWPPSAVCTAAADMLATARSALEAACDRLRSDLDLRNALAAAAAAAWTLTAALFVGAGAATATVFGVLVAAFLWVAAWVMYYIAAALTGALIGAQIAVSTMYGEVSVDRDAFQRALAAAQGVCCPGDLVATSEPACP